MKTKRNYFANAYRVAVRTGSALQYLLSEHLGSASVVTNASENGVGRQLFTPLEKHAPFRTRVR